MKQTPWLAFSIDRSSPIPVFEQICTAIRKRIISGELAEGGALPPTRAFATELGVSRSTIVTAYEQLMAEGYITSLQGSGYKICKMGEVELAKPPQSPSAHTAEDPVISPFPFQASQPDMRLFPHRQWAKTVARLCRTQPEKMLVGATRFGNSDLRKAIAEHVSEWRGIDAAPHQIIVTAGSTDALEICLRTLSVRGDTIGLENPGYPPVRQFAKTHSLTVEDLSVDIEGAMLPSPRSVACLAVLTPSHQYPLGGAMSPNRRLAFLAWAEAQNAWVIEDDYDSEFRYSGRPIPAMAGFDRLSKTIYIGSFSKIFSNSLRLGYLIVPNPLINRFHEAIQRFGQRASFMPQQALAEFMTSGEFHRHLRRVRRTYGERQKYLLDALKRDFVDFGKFVDHQAGMQIVFHLNEGFEDREICKRAAKLGVATLPLSALGNGTSKYNGLILGYCGFSEGEMRPALAALKTCFTA